MDTPTTTESERAIKADDLMDAREVAELCGCTVAQFQSYRARRPPLEAVRWVPEPLRRIGYSPVWVRSAVLEALERSRRPQDGPGAAA